MRIIRYICERHALRIGLCFTGVLLCVLGLLSLIAAMFLISYVGNTMRPTITVLLIGVLPMMVVGLTLILPEVHYQETL